MSLLEHLEELRKRIVRACIAIAVGVAVSFVYIDRLVAFVFAPMRRALPPGATMIYTAPGEAFGLYVNIALIAGAALASPFIMFQLWRFIAPALYANEKKLVIPFVALSSAMPAGTVAASAAMPAAAPAEPPVADQLADFAAVLDADAAQQPAEPAAAVEPAPAPVTPTQLQ